jgi:hypothetical protein
MFVGRKLGLHGSPIAARSPFCENVMAGLDPAIAT